jgi:hypothetical protein
MNKRHSHALDRRGFLKLGVGAGAAISLNLRRAFAQERPAWEARPANPGLGSACFDRHAHALGSRTLHESSSRNGTPCADQSLSFGFRPR